MKASSAIEAVINNAQRTQELVEREGSLAAFIWRYEPDKKQFVKTQTASISFPLFNPCSPVRTISIADAREAKRFRPELLALHMGEPESLHGQFISKQ